MNVSTIKKSLIIIALAILPISMFAQNENKTEKVKPVNYLYVDVDGGGTVLFGDNKPFQFSKMRMQGRFGFGYNFVGCLSVYGKVGYGSVAGDYEKYFSGKGNYLLYNANFAVDLINLIGGYKEDRVFGLKLHGGVGHIQYRSTATRANGTEYRFGYSDCEGNAKGKGFGGRKVAIEVPMGMELNFNVSKLIDVYADITTSFVDTDKLDGFPNGKHKDWYSTGNIGVRFKFQCGKKETVAEPTPEPVVVEKPVVVEEPVKEEPVVVKAEPVRTETTIAISFKKNTSEIDMESSSQAISELINKIGNAKIENIKVVGYASPEGKDDFNRNVAMQRANAAKDYVVKELAGRADNATFDISSVGADWDRFLAALYKSKIRDREMIFNKISNSSYKAGTLWTFKANYPELQDLYPVLRRAEVTVTAVSE